MKRFAVTLLILLTPGFTACQNTMRAEPYEHNDRWQGWQHI